MRNEQQKLWSLGDFVSATAKAAGVDEAEIKGKNRTQPLAAFRQAGMALAHQHGYGSPTVGVRFGYRDHTTVLYAVNRLKSGGLEAQAIRVQAALTGQEVLL